MQQVERNNESRNQDSVLSQSETSVWNIDGELVESPHIHIM